MPGHSRICPPVRSRTSCITPRPCRSRSASASRIWNQCGGSGGGSGRARSINPPRCIPAGIYLGTQTVGRRKRLLSPGLGIGKEAGLIVEFQTELVAPSRTKFEAVPGGRPLLLPGHADRSDAIIETAVARSWQVAKVRCVSVEGDAPPFEVLVTVKRRGPTRKHADR